MFSASRISRGVSKSAVKSISGIPGWRAHVIYADHGVLVINKPSGLESQPGPPPKKNVRPDSVRPILERFQEGKYLPRPSHRLDKRTSGALLCARNAHQQISMNAQFATREIQRKYLAILRGGEKSFPEKEFKVRTLLEIDDGHVSVVKGAAEGQENDRVEEVDEEGKPKRTWAETTVKVLATSPDLPLTLVELEPKTGRRHQLRVHAAHIRAPILGDSRYASAILPPQITKLLDELEAQRRAEIEADALRKGKKLKHIRKKFEFEEQDVHLFLHAAHIEITRYRPTGNHKRLRLGITAPLPRYFVNLCKLASLPLPEEYITGGVYVDGVKKEDGAVEELDGKWRIPASKQSKLAELSPNDQTPVANE